MGIGIGNIPRRGVRLRLPQKSITTPSIAARKPLEHRDTATRDPQIQHPKMGSVTPSYATCRTPVIPSVNPSERPVTLCLPLPGHVRDRQQTAQAGLPYRLHHSRPPVSSLGLAARLCRPSSSLPPLYYPRQSYRHVQSESTMRPTTTWLRVGTTVASRVDVSSMMISCLF
jgi:hypothetical protein